VLRTEMQLSQSFESCFALIAALSNTWPPSFWG
jgi:hypothetical protein